ncbi:hypothetical protein WOLCODRAFT_26822 [Wolfiporia cocos MD-104 SS10]|uniref:Secreted protein n=1 Tax=Wolfiporia cocos (strain MD-104) TaxID=742152 RepID=A0A2H3JRF5_WOLCO|nr:hypothetical protein WOLCODRAFT_26822 [Wolfiporia cocos MD-104 SS10]
MGLHRQLVLVASAWPLLSAERQARHRTALCACGTDGGKFGATLRGHIGPVYRLMRSAYSRMLVSESKGSTVER